MDPGHHYNQRTALAAGAMTIDLGAAYRHLTFRLSGGASSVHYRINADGVTTEATTSNVLLPDSDVWNADGRRVFTEGVSHLYLYALGSTGYIEVEAC